MGIWNKQNYLNKDVTHIINSPIREYDMKSGGFNILKHHNAFTKEELIMLEEMPKYERNVWIGNFLRKNKELNKVLMDGFKEGIRLFIEYNMLNENDILSIKKDAIYVINKPAIKLEFDCYNFRLDNTFSSYYYLNNKEIYFNGKTKEITIKGLSNEVVRDHEEYFLKELTNIFTLAERSNTDSIIRYIRKFRNDYLEMEFELGMYRELNSNNAFRLEETFMDMNVLSDGVDEDTDIEIGYNYVQYIVPLIKIFV